MNNVTSFEEEKKPKWKIHQEAVEDQGRKYSWIAKKLNCSYALVHKYLHGKYEPYAKDWEPKFDKLLFGGK